MHGETYILSFVDGYYVVINLKNNRISDLKTIVIYSENHKKQIYGAGRKRSC